MKESIYKYPSKREDELLLFLNMNGVTSFYIESEDEFSLLHVYGEELNKTDGLDFLTKEHEKNLNEEDWAGKFYEGVDGLAVNDEIYIRYNPEFTPEEPYGFIIDLDPVKSFGDGNHATTRMCLVILYDLIHSGLTLPLEKNSMIDIGTGTGILSIIAHKMGLTNIQLFDIDDESIIKCNENLERNKIKSIEAFKSDLYKHNFKIKYDIVSANLLTAIIEDNLDKLIDIVEIRGYLIISGISSNWTDEILGLLNDRNIEICRHLELEGWNGFLLRKLA